MPRILRPGADLQDRKALPQPLVYCTGLVSSDGKDVECGADMEGGEDGDDEHLSPEDKEGVQQSTLR